MMRLDPRLFWVAMALTGWGCGSDEAAPDGGGSDTAVDASDASSADADAAGLPDLCDPDPCTLTGTVCAPDDGLCHCGAVSGPVCGTGEICDPQTGDCAALPPPKCSAPSAWVPGAPTFVEATEAWGLAAVGVEGTRLSVGDIDGDGWADVFVRRGGTRYDDFGPEGARHNWLLRNTGGAFEDVTVSSGVLAPRGSQEGALGRAVEVVSFADVDNDGDLDVYTGVTTVDPAASLGETSEILLNDGAGHFALGPADHALRRAGELDAPASASFVDFDRDGVVDVWLPQHDFQAPGSPGTSIVQARLFRGAGGGAFTDVTRSVGLATEPWIALSAMNGGLAHTRSWSGAACDLNGDGTAELLASSYGRSPNHLSQGSWASGAVTFTNRSVASGYAYDDDFTWQDNQFAQCYCKQNPGDEGCDGVAEPVVGCGQPNWNHQTDRQPYRLGGNSGATVCADIDNDGDIDLFTTEIKHWWAGSGSDGSEVLVNTGEADVRFERPGDSALGLAISHPPYNWDEGHMTAALFDFDNDGWQDLYVGGSDYAGNRGLLYRQTQPLLFYAVSPQDFFEHNRSHGVVAADFDRDGDLDVLVGHSRARCDDSQPNDCYPTMQIRAFENVFGQDGNWLQVHLRGGEGTNRAAIGARVTVETDAATQTQEVDGGHGHFNTQRDLVLHFGLAGACEARVTVRWPDAALTEETWELGAGYRYEVAQGAAPVVAD
jgi:hypothetical protein